ncbi:DNA-processing protein DprA [Brevibacillus borstelensis]|uniref:DNA-processing protein DprA n=1 Tax=Brevibacillus borstelensis TaxID=45462 RepID=UPI002E236E03|nr:DNA-protecting protein DprA [Brevibacillus borstelensis]
MLDKLHILTLMGLPGFGRNTVNNIVHEAPFNPSNLKEIMDLLRECKKKFSRIKLPEIETLEDSFNNANRTVEKCEKLGIRILGVNDDTFPVRLRYIPDPPILLFAKGNIDCLNHELSVAVIGTREPSKYGEICGELFGKAFAERGLVVVSGLAKGIDTTGHKGCLLGNGHTVAVLAQGLDTGIYPSENRPLAQEILDADGCWISEYSLGVRGRPNFFVERDRLQAGLSAGVVVMETDIKGGTMHTVGFCLAQSKPLGCFNHPEKFLVGNNKARGNRQLIDQGKAQPLFTPEDIDLFISKMEKLSDLRKRIDSISNQTQPNKKENTDEQLELF